MVVSGRSLGALVALALSSATLGCGGASSSAPRASFPGRTDGRATLSALPEVELSSPTTERFRRGMTLAEASFRVSAPEAPESREASTLARWSDGALRAWLEQKTHAIQAAREDLDAAAEEEPDQRVLGGAVVGLMYEDLARSLLAVPAPSELDSEPEVLGMYRDLVESQSRPFLALARAAYRACSLNATARPELRVLIGFCRARGEALPGEEPTPASGETEVEVVHGD